MNKIGTFFFLAALSLQAGAWGSQSEYFKKGLGYYQRGEFELAAAHFEEAKRAEPREPLVFFYLGNVYYQLKEIDKAIVNYTGGLDLADRKGPYFYNLGNCYYLKGNFTFSAEMYAMAAAVDPTLYDSHLNAGNSYYRQGDYRNTVVQWETYLSVYPETPQYENIAKAIAYLKEELDKADAGGADAGGAADQNGLMEGVMADLEGLLNRTANVMETSAKPIDDLSNQDIER